MPTIRQALAKANKALKPKIDDALTREVFEEVRYEEMDSIDQVVYEAVPEGTYRRRGRDGGLGEECNVVIDGGRAKNGRLVVKNVTPANPFLDGRNIDGGLSTTPLDAPIAGLVEHGTFARNGYGYDYWPHPKARPFTKKAIEHLRASGSYADALRRGLQRQKVKVS